MGIFLVLVLVTELSAVYFVSNTVPRTSFMARTGEPIAYQYVSIDHMSRYVVESTIAHEDPLLGSREGPFLVEDCVERAKAYVDGKPDPSGSTIPQQLVKNIYLTPERAWWRKAVEAGLATEFSLTLSPKRILELYLNYAQFGPEIYGICAATWYYYGHSPAAMTEHEAAELMGVLPVGDRVKRAPEGGIYLNKVEDALVLLRALLLAVNICCNLWRRDIFFLSRFFRSAGAPHSGATPSL